MTVNEIIEAIDNAGLDHEKLSMLETHLMTSIIQVNCEVDLKKAEELTEQYRLMTVRYGNYLMSQEAAYALVDLVEQFGIDFLVQLDLDILWQLVHNIANDNMHEAIEDYENDVEVACANGADNLKKVRVISHINAFACSAPVNCDGKRVTTFNAMIGADEFFGADSEETLLDTLAERTGKGNEYRSIGYRVVNCYRNIILTEVECVSKDK